jgi:dTDP-4-amino-4,6-dideoxygalactose transaminase
MSDIEAAMGRAQLERYPELLSKRQLIAELYRKNLPETVTPQPVTEHMTHAYHRFAIQTTEQAELANYLNNHNISVSSGIRLPLYDYNVAENFPPEEELSGTEIGINRNLLLPMHTGLDTEDVRFVIETIGSFFRS